MRGQMANFPEIGNFPDAQVHISKTINSVKTNLLPPCSTFSYEQNGILFWYLDQILVMHSIPGGNNVTLTGKTARGQNQRKALIDI